MATKTIDLNPGTATLASHYDTDTDHTVWIVHVDDEAAAHFLGDVEQTDVCIGGIAKLSNQWNVTAYRDRENLKAGTGLVYFLPSTTSRARAVRALLRWWSHVHRQEHDSLYGLDPFELPARQRRDLFR